MNKGIERIDGDYIIFLNSGDSFVDGKVLSCISRVLEKKKEIDFIYGDSVEFDKENNKFYKKARNSQYIWYSMFAHHQSMLFKYDIIKDKRYNLDYPYTSDYDFVCRILKRRPHVYKLNIPISMFEQGGVSFTLKGKKRGIKDQRKIKRKVLGLNGFVVNFISIIHIISNLIRIVSPKFFYYIRGMKKN